MIQIKQQIKKTIIHSLGLHLPISFFKTQYQIPYKLTILSSLFTNLDYVYCNINFDDQCPVYKQIDSRDYGGKINEGISKKLKLFLEQNPDVAITSFVIPNFKGNTKEFKDKFLLTNPEYSEWISFYTDLAKKFNLEYAIHGYFHVQKENPFFQPYSEFAFKSHDQALNCLSRSLIVFKEIEWPVTGFRQPGWDLSTSINLPQIAKSLKLKYIATNSYNAGYNAGGIERVNNYYPSLMDGIINFPQNIELDWPIELIYQNIDRLVKMKAFISIKGHFVDHSYPNCLNNENFKKMYLIVDYINKSNTKFITLKDLANLICFKQKGDNNYE